MKRWIDADITHITLQSLIDGEIVLNKLCIPIGKKMIFCLHGITTNIFTVISKT